MVLRVKRIPGFFRLPGIAGPYPTDTTFVIMQNVKIDQ